MRKIDSYKVGFHYDLDLETSKVKILSASRQQTFVMVQNLSGGPPLVDWVEVRCSQKIHQNDQFIKLRFFCFGSNSTMVITMEEAHPMSTRGRSGEVRLNT